MILSPKLNTEKDAAGCSTVDFRRRKLNLLVDFTSNANDYNRNIFVSSSVIFRSIW